MSTLTTAPLVLKCHIVHHPFSHSHHLHIEGVQQGLTFDLTFFQFWFSPFMCHLLLIMVSHNTTTQLCVPKWGKIQFHIDRTTNQSNACCLALQNTTNIVYSTLICIPKNGKGTPCPLCWGHHQRTTFTPLVFKQ